MIQTSYSAKQIATILGGEHLLIAPNSSISYLLIDSKKETEFENCLFFALVSDIVDGHQFIDEMYQKGVRNFVVSKPVSNLSKANVFQVNDTLEALQTLANYQSDNTLQTHQTHQTQLEINLDALKHNLNFYRGKVEENVKIMVMVKANAYGAGSCEVAQFLAEQDVNYLGVAYVDEGVSIRQAGVVIPIMVMNPSVMALATMIDYNLEPEIYSLEILHAYNHVLQSKGMLGSSHKIHLKLDTGMNRLGFKSVDIEAVLEVLNNEKHLKVVSVFSHLAVSDDLTQDEFTETQIELFEAVSQKIERSLGYSFIRHISNSAAIERFKNAQFDMVRLGIGLYGTASDDKNQNQLKTVSSLYSIVVQTKNVKKGESIGYGRSFFADTDMRIAIIPIGYADGLNRRLSNGVGSVFVSGQKRPIVGTICMDIIMVDITGLPTQVNDSVEIFGDNISAQEVAANAGTISYEIFTSISARVKRVYINEGS